MAYTGGRVALNGVLQYEQDKNSFRIFIPAFKQSFKTSGLENCQTVFSNAIIFIGVFTSEDTIDIKAIDDLPSEDLCEELQANSGVSLFLPVVHYGNVYMTAVQAERCGIDVKDGEACINIGINGEKVEANLGVIKDVEMNKKALSTWFFEPGRLVLITGYEDDVTIDKENKTLIFKKATYRFC